MFSIRNELESLKKNINFSFFVIIFRNLDLRILADF